MSVVMTDAEIDAAIEARTEAMDVGQVLREEGQWVVVLDKGGQLKWLGPAMPRSSDDQC